MELSSKSEYALLALLELANCYCRNESLQIQQIALLQNIPNRYLEQLLAILRRGGLIKSIRGAKGGYILARDPQQITLLDVLNCIEGVESTSTAGDTTSKTTESKIIQEIWCEARQAANSVWQKYTLQDLCDLRDNRQQVQFMYYI
ncbi:MAG: Rrf2 family transcriptional regulator [Spirirestis rafaelensis WJT71-NPBG6]|jgi:Rrf2 family protein|nr:Rrf2 family transcriptional regulator [Spirirestis rafaelensis WJT71-NPBG6]